MILTDPLRTHLLPVLEASPLQAGSLYTSYKDLGLSVEWHDLRTLMLPGTGWTAIIGHKNRQDPLRIVIPLPLHTTALRPSILKSIFTSLASLRTDILPPADEPLVSPLEEVQAKWASRKENDRSLAEFAETEAETVMPSDVNTEIERETIYLAIVTNDSTVVYYKLSKGIKKPADIPDE